MRTLEIRYRIDAYDAKPSTTVDTPGAYDVGVDVEICGRTVHGEVTLCPRDADGKLSAWGEGIDHWMSSDLVALCREFGDEHGYNRALVDAIETEALDTIAEREAV